MKVSFDGMTGLRESLMQSYHFRSLGSSFAERQLATKSFTSSSGIAARDCRRSAGRRGADEDQSKVVLKLVGEFFQLVLTRLYFVRATII
jgi:hypothetical protein